MRRSVSFSAVLFAIFTLAGFWLSSARAADLATPETATSAYIDAIARQDFQAIIAVTAADNVSEHFDFVASSSRLQMLNPSYAMPPTNPFFVEINRGKFIGRISQEVQLLIYGLMTTDSLSKNSATRLDAKEASNFVSAVHADRLKSLSLVKVGIPNPGLMGNKTHQANMALTARNNGADEMTERVALLSFENNQYAIGLTLLRYGKDWTVLSQASIAAAIKGLGDVKRVSAAEFEEILH